MTTDLRVSMVAGLTDRLTAPMQRMLSEANKRLAEVNTLSETATRKLAGLTAGANALGGGKGLGKLKEDLAGVSLETDRAAKNTGKLSALLAKLPGLARNIAAGYGAAKYVLADPLQRASDYELQLARVSNIAYADRGTVAGRQAGQREMDKAVRTAAMQGVTREDALVGLKTMIGAGTGRDDAMKLLPTIAKFSMAGEASMGDVANIALKAQQNFQIKPEQMPQAMQMALTAGKLGQFEFKDMAHWLPEQMSIAKNMLGMQGMGDLPTLLAANQFAARTAGSNSAAGNNLVNFLSKINSDDTRKDAAKLDIDLTGSLVKAREQGTNQVDAFMNLMRKTAEADPQYRQLQTRLQTARESGDKGDQVQTLGAMRDLMMGKSVGKLVQDRQAMLGLLGILNDPKGFNAMREDISKSQGGVDVDQATLMATSAMKFQQGENAMLSRQFDALQGVNQQLGDYQVRLAQLSGEYPQAAAALEALRLAALSAAAILAAMGVMQLLNKAPAVPTPVGGGGPVGRAAGVAAMLPAALAVGAAGVAGYAGGTALYRGALQDTKYGDKLGEEVARVMAFFGSDEAASSIASRNAYEASAKGPAPTAVGGSKGAPVSDRQELARAIDAIGNRPLQVKLFLDGREINAHTEEETAYQARRR